MLAPPMSRDEATLETGEPEEHRAPAGTWASEPGDAEDLEAASSTERVSEAPRPNGAPLEASEAAAVERPSPPPARRDPTGAGRARAEGRAPRTPSAEASDSHVRPRFLASELLRRRAESFEPIWPTASRALAAAGGALAAALALAFAATGPAGIALALLCVLVGVVAVAPVAPPLRAAALALLGGLVVVVGALLSGRTSELLLGGAALTATAGAFLRARRFSSRGARGLFVVAAALGVAGLALDGGVHVLSIASFAIADVAPAVRQLFLGAALLLPLVTLLDAHGPSGAVAVAIAWILERLIDGGFHVALEGATPEALGPLLGALVLPAAGLALAQAMPSAALGPRRAARAHDG